MKVFKDLFSPWPSPPSAMEEREKLGRSEEEIVSAASV